MDTDYLAIGGTIQEATRPRKSGVMRNVHAVHQKMEPAPDYKRMLEVVEGKREKETPGPHTESDEQR